MLLQIPFVRSALLGAAFFMAAGTAAAQPDIDPSQLDFEAYGNGRETGVTADPTAASGTAPWPSQVQKSFLGVNFDDNAEDNDGFRFIPPDPIGAVGHSRVISVVNTMIESRTKGGKKKWRSSLAEFFAPLEPKTFTFDPKIVYDQYEDRFVVVTLERVNAGTSFADPGNESRILLAVSKSGNPQTNTEADWYYLSIDAKLTGILGFGLDFWADYPGFEVDEEAIYVTANYFVHPGDFGGFGGSYVWIVAKDPMYSGGTSAANVYYPAGASGFFDLTQMPAQVFGDGGVGGAGSTIGTFLVGYSGLTFGGPGGVEAAQVITIDDPLGANGGPFFSGEFVVIGDIENVGGGCSFPALSDAPQAGTDALIEVNDRRALDAVWRDDGLWMVMSIDGTGPCDPAVAGTTKAHWVAMDTSAGSGAIVQIDGGTILGDDISSGDSTTFFPAIAVNRYGDAAVGFSASSPDIYAGAFAAKRSAGDPAGTIGPTQTVKAGDDYYLRTFGGTRNRWGDYSGIALDPSNEKFFWVFNLYAAPRADEADSRGEDGRWGTAWGRVK